jgi:hypothetical protein
MFEFKTSLHPIPTNQLILYYLIALFIYILFLRKYKNLQPYLLLFFLLFNQGYIILLDDANRPSKVLFIILSFIIIIKRNK